MKRLIRMALVAVALFVFLWLGKRLPKANSPEAIQSILALFVAVIVTVEMLIEVALSAAVARLVPWVIVLLAFTTVAKTSWPAAVSLGIVTTAVIVCEVIKHRPVIISRTASDGDE